MVIRRLSLLVSLLTAGPPAAFAVVLVFDGQYATSLVFGGLATFMFVLPEYILRRLPRPREALTSRLPWREDP